MKSLKLNLNPFELKMRKILKVKDWIDNKYAVESVMRDWVERVRTNNTEGIKAQNLTPIVDPETGELSITIKYDPQISFS